jgi:hypothetical protein
MLCVVTLCFVLTNLCDKVDTSTRAGRTLRACRYCGCVSYSANLGTLVQHKQYKTRPRQKSNIIYKYIESGTISNYAGSCIPIFVR